jgi:hypothetical protein
MCGRKREPIRQAARTGEDSSYTGETVSLGTESRSSTRPTCSGKYQFPFWLLWLIWPLAGLIKLVIPWLAGGLVLVGQSVLPLWPVVLIAIGLLLLRRR